MSCLHVFAINCPNGVLSNYTISGNSVQNGTPTPSLPIDVVSVGDLVTDTSDPNYGKYKIPVVVGSNCGVVDLGTLDYSILDQDGKRFFRVYISDAIGTHAWLDGNIYSSNFITSSEYNLSSGGNRISATMVSSVQKCQIRIRGPQYDSMGAESFKSAMSGKYLYYQRLTDSSWAAPSVTYIYANAPLRKVRSYADVLNSDGTITRNVGVKVLDGTENWARDSYGTTNWAFLVNITDAPSTHSSVYMDLLNTHYSVGNVITTDKKMQWGSATNKALYISDMDFTTGAEFKTYLAAQYAAGTPVTVYYPLATPTTENITLPSISMNNGDNIVTIGTSIAPSGTNVWPASLSCILASAGIKVATTKYVEDKFATSVSELNTTMGTIKNVVDNTIIQADRIGKLHTGKQNRPAENCPDGAQCLLITEADGSLHWYPICNADGTVGTQSSN